MTVENNDNVSAHVIETNLTIPAERYIVTFTQNEARRLTSKPPSKLSSYEVKRLEELQYVAKTRPITDELLSVLTDDNRFMFEHLPKNVHLTRFQLGLMMHETTFRRVELEPSSKKILHTFLCDVSVLPNMSKTLLKQVVIHAGKKFHNSDMIHPIVNNVVFHNECQHDIVWNSIDHVTLSVLRARNVEFQERIEELRKKKYS